MLSNPWLYFSKHPFHLYDDDDTSVQVTAIALCQVSDIIAIATSNGRISFFNSEGEKHATRDDIASKESYYSELVWRPHGGGDKQLVGGRADGQIFSWIKGNSHSGDDNTGGQRAYIIKNDDTVHSEMIRFLTWNDSKSADMERLLSIDHGGICCIWKANENGINPIMKIDSSIVITSFAFLPETMCTNCISSFILGSVEGEIFHFDEHGKKQLVYSQSFPDAIDYTLCDEGVNDVIVITRSLMMFQFTFQQDGSVLIKTTAKLEIESMGKDADNLLHLQIRDVILTNGGKLVVLAENGVVQCWDLRTDETYVLDPYQYHDNRHFDPALSFVYSSEFNMLVVGTQSGKCFFWEDSPFLNDASLDNQRDPKWKNSFCSDLADCCQPDIIRFGKTVLIQSLGNMLSFKQKWLLSVHKDGKAAIQTDQESIVVFHDFFDKPSAILETFMNIEGLAIDTSYVCVWSECEIQIYQIEDRKCELFSEISMALQSLVIAQEMLYIAQGRSLLVTDLYGAQRLTIRLPEGEGHPKYLDSTPSYLALCTDNGTVRVMDITKKEPQLILSRIHALDRSEFPLRSILSIKCNADCTLLSILTTDENNSSKRCVHFFHMENGHFSSLQEKFSVSHSVMSHFWDPAEPRVFSCEIRYESSELPRVLTLFIGPNAEILLHRDAELPSWSSTAAGVAVPYVFHLERNSEYPIVTRKPTPYQYLWEKLKAYESCTVENSELISAVTDFSFYIASEDLDKAFICATSIINDQTWKTLVSVCVRNGNLNMAKSCLIEMGHKDATEAVRNAEKNPEIEVALAQVAIHLDMVEEVEFLYRKCQRNDLLCDFFREQGLWTEAFEVAKNDALLEKSLQYHLGKDLEDKGNDVVQAFDHYEKSSLSQSKVLLRKMIERGLPVDNFLRRTDNNELITLYASYMETSGEVSQAKGMYSTVGDTLNLVRLACAEGNVEKAFEIVHKSGSESKASYYHLARHLEAEGDISRALACYSMSGMYNYAIRVCKANDGFHEEMFGFAMKSKTPQVLSSAQYFRQKGELEKSARLYVHGGQDDKAIEILMEIPFNEDTFHLHTEYASLIEELDVSINKETLQKYANYLIKTGKSQRALTMLKSKGSSISDIMSICVSQNVQLDEDLIDHIYSTGCDANTLKSIAEACQKQGNHKLACKKFTQAGDKINAIKSLFSSGDVQSIVAYANASRSKDVYVLAANHLQKLQIHDQNEDPKMKKIMVQFYTKAKAFPQLISLLITWSDYEAAEGEYELARQWLNEAKKFEKKIANSNLSREYSHHQIDENINAINEFLSARENSSLNPEHAKAVCVAFLEKGKGPIQAGDCYALLLDLEEDYGKAYDYIQAMIDANISPENFIDEETIASIYIAVDKVWQRNIEDDGSTSYVDQQSQVSSSEESLESTGILALDQKDQEVMAFAIERDWNSVRELIADHGSELSLKLVCSLFTTGPPQSVAVAIMRVKPAVFSEKDERGRCPLHYLCCHGASTYTIIFVIQRWKSALVEKDEDNKTPLDYVLSESWQLCQEDQNEVIATLQSMTSKN